MIGLVEQQKNAIASLCRQHKVKRLDVFGSAARGNFVPGRSDLDFIVQFTSSGFPGYADAFLDFAESLERLLGNKVDLLTERMIRNPYFRAEVENTRENIYDERDETTPH